MLMKGDVVQVRLLINDGPRLDVRQGSAAPDGDHDDHGSGIMSVSTQRCGNAFLVLGSRMV